MEQLGDKGEGHYAYVDNLQEAKRVFVDNLTGTLQVIARDVKIQVDFNPEVVRSYRLIGYENRDVADEDFRNDTVDGGEIGSAHQVTALYEMKLLAEAKGILGTVSVRYKDPESKQVTEVSREIGAEVFAGSFDQAEPSLRLAACAAQFAEILRKSYWAKGETIDSLLTQTSAIYAESKNSETLDLMGLMNKARKFKTELAVK
jgi:Ca-activated chloride channel homolog